MHFHNYLSLNQFIITITPTRHKTYSECMFIIHYFRIVFKCTSFHYA